jgi:formylglycine-generating enzyme required for sulfatase activity
MRAFSKTISCRSAELVLLATCWFAAGGLGAAEARLDFNPTATPTLQWLPAPLDLSASVAASEAAMEPYTETIGSSDVTFQMVPIPGGTFWRGSPDEEADRRDDEGPRHEVTIEPFWMGRCEVTWDEYNLWAGVVDGLSTDDIGDPGSDFDDPARRKMEQIADAITRPTKPSSDVTHGMGKSGYPAFGMTPLAARLYCKWLCAKTGRYYRLPTEAEWEYACRAGTTTAYSFGDDPGQLEDYAWFFDNADDRCQKVGQKKANPWGLHDMHGNVWEWVLDAYAADEYRQYAGQSASNPLRVPCAAQPLVMRGGCWDDDAHRLRSAARGFSDRRWNAGDPQSLQSIWQLPAPSAPGFRIVRPLRLPTSEEAKLFEPDHREIEQYQAVPDENRHIPQPSSEP